MHCANCGFYIASPWAAVSLRVEIRLSLALLAQSVLSQLIFKTTGSKSHCYTNSWNAAPLVFKARRYRICFSPCGLPEAFPSLHPQLPPSFRHLPTTFSILPNLFDVASFLYLVVSLFCQSSNSRLVYALGCDSYLVLDMG